MILKKSIFSKIDFTIICSSDQQLSSEMFLLIFHIFQNLSGLINWNILYM